VHFCFENWQLQEREYLLVVGHASVMSSKEVRPTCSWLVLEVMQNQGRYQNDTISSHEQHIHLSFCDLSTPSGNLQQQKGQNWH
jgi:hypothetical protein